MDRGQQTAKETIWSLLDLDENITEDLIRARLQHIVSIHAVQFQKMLFEPATLQPELRLLFESIGKRYLAIAAELPEHQTIVDPSDPILNNSRNPES
jgi:hypothetical protein